MRKDFKKDTSGQVIIVTALIIAMLLLSTALYVIETIKNVPTINPEDDSSDFLNYKQTVRNTLVSALANATAQSNPNILWTDLTQLKSTITSQSYRDILKMEFNTLNNTNYQNGIWISWGSLGNGVSSAYATLSFNSSGQSSSSFLTYFQNITSELHESGSYQQVNSTFKQVSLLLNVENEGKPALASTFGFSYQNGTSWIAASSPTITDHGDGSYSASFYAESPVAISPINVAVNCIDTRDISTGANVTCSS